MAMSRQYSLLTLMPGENGERHAILASATRLPMRHPILLCRPK